jgi:Mg/Co/Ni transporter MgtE
LDTIKKEVFIGLVIGLIANTAGSYLYIYFFSDYDLEYTIKNALMQDVFGNIIALGAILNLLVFFIFLKKNQFYRARGVVLATVVAAIIILVTKFY